MNARVTLRTACAYHLNHLQMKRPFPLLPSSIIELLEPNAMGGRI
jgi:hypothetical protein